jgi:cytosine/adenosine deaminase-related metal-dependent hydrolase
MMTTVIRNATLLATMDAQRREIADGALVIEGNQIAWVGATADLAPDLLDGAATVIDARGRVVLPGFVNTHHHFYQTLTRAVPAAQDVVLFDWLKTLYPIWAELTPDDVFVSTQLALTELLLSGCTTSSDHHYLWPNGSRLDDQFAAAETIGVRFHGARGSMSLGESQGGLPPDRVTEKRRSCATAAAWSRPSTTPAALPCAASSLAPCSPFSVTPDLMRESAALARSFGPALNVHLHTHLAETPDEEAVLPGALRLSSGRLRRIAGWTGDDVWHAHCVHLNQAEIENFARTHTGVAHCPSSNMRLASGIAPVRACATRACPSAWAWTAAPATTAAICWPRCASACSCSGCWATRGR